MIAFAVVYVVDDQKPTCSLRGFEKNGLSNSSATSFQCVTQSSIFFTISFTFQITALTIFNVFPYTATKIIYLLVCIKNIFSSHFLVSVMSNKNMALEMSNLESMRFAFRNKWATVTIIFPHANQNVSQQPL